MENILVPLAAAMGIFTGLGHSYLGERYMLIPLFREREAIALLAQRRFRDTLRIVWHLPSVVWAIIGVFLFVFPGNAPLRYLAAAVYASCGIGNLIAIRKPHPGNIILSAAAALLLAS